MPTWARVTGHDQAALDQLRDDLAAALGSDPDRMAVVSAQPPGAALVIWSVELPRTVTEERHVEEHLQARGMIWAEHYSVLCPTGESGFFAPLETGAVLVDRADFDVARAVGWRTAPPGELAPGFTFMGACQRCGALGFVPHQDGIRCQGCDLVEAVR